MLLVYVASLLIFLSFTSGSFPYFFFWFHRVFASNLSSLKEREACSFWWFSYSTVSLRAGFPGRVGSSGFSRFFGGCAPQPFLQKLWFWILLNPVQECISVPSLPSGAKTNEIIRFSRFVLIITNRGLNMVWTCPKRTCIFVSFGK